MQFKKNKNQSILNGTWECVDFVKYNSNINKSTVKQKFNK